MVGDLLAGAAADELATQVGAAHIHSVREVYTIISAGRPSEVGLRGYPAVQTIISAGAGNQRSEAVLNLLFGDAVRGLPRRSRRCVTCRPASRLRRCLADRQINSTLPQRRFGTPLSLLQTLAQELDEALRFSRQQARFSPGLGT
ncbi:hypothetical protein GCM10010869_27810 [Mesorhizobium tianshanense]|uniref:hypothetical protein n=1 Tax=Mesorhizobium tianshanense TaxID=39844 RepID=UPI001ABEECF8|nr:hypothetical protein [Mesorhizobium tianshanense]GLS37188.1 hypothetical protein GCM10010869_27810 [Mesorhizobium tianshanense]